MVNLRNNSADTTAASPRKDALGVDASGGQEDWGSQEDGLCYLVTLSLSDALTAEQKNKFSAVKKELTRLLSEAGLRGARSLMKKYAGELETLFMEEVETVLDANQGKGGLLPHFHEWAALFQNTPGCRLLNFSLRSNHLHVLFRLSGEKALAHCVDEWQKKFPTFDWEPGFHSLLVQEKDIVRYASLVAADRSDETAILQQETQDCSITLEEVPDFHHITVLLNETVDLLRPSEGKVIVDTTLGGGGHSELLLQRGATVIGIDQDPEARRAACARLARFGNKFRVLSGNFRDIESLLHHEGIGQVDGILADIGVSSHQIDKAERGFSFRENGPLDMRMSPDIKLSAADIVNTADEAELARIFWEYGEERASRSLARLIVQTRAASPLSTTTELATLTEKAIPRRSGHHPGTKAFQALRIAVNDELGALNDLLDASVRLLHPEGILAVITFHSLEDRCVKRFLELRSKAEIDRPEWPEPRPNPEYYFNLLTRRPITAGEQELKSNPRSRSAKLRGAQRTTQR